MSAQDRSNRDPTINDVASLAGVSKKTVSRFINGLPGLKVATRDRVEQAIVELGYVPNPQARALALGRNFTVVLLHDNPNAQTVQIFERGILDAIRDSELGLMVRPVDRNSPSLLDDIEAFLRKQRPIGVIVLPPISERDEIAVVFRSMGVRFVRVGSAALDDDRHSVTSTDRIAVTEACQLLIAMGHRRIGFVRGPQGFRSAAERELGFHAALAAAGIPVSPEYCAQGDYRFESGRSAGRLLLGLDPRPTAIFASNDEMAAGVMHAAFERNLQIPRDLSLVGFDDSPTATHVWPSLTTVRWPIRDMGMLAAEKLLGDFLPQRRFSGDSVHLPSELIERSSIAPPLSGA
ncbi:LacI family transcriptional regulator [Porphyrobacter sp. HT-58-2]|uniref:LacI family DNA-binding transcriptional regulator n=1 Tax=Porphyrobacter sp. HT-58-2 TaxID=2023229 RepID=UPI000CDC6DDA|nr:LacI family DNA-binding transcriptional regulator [Porphyrobacter sp. HT-58-2]AUX69683.1 LacI family transcriptional regulator [Porphyrobacter sp. HT-58-2]